jgi:hypothetical protein
MVKMRTTHHSRRLPKGIAIEFFVSSLLIRAAKIAKQDAINLLFFNKRY